MTHSDLPIARAVLHHLIEVVASGNLAQLSASGISITVARELSDLSAIQFAELVRAATGAVRVEIDEGELRHALTNVRSTTRNRQIEDELLRLGASLPAMRELFGWPGYQYAARRQSIGITSPGGRPRFPTREEEDLIYRAWQKHAELPTVERILATAHASSIPISSLWPWLKPLLESPASAQLHSRTGEAARAISIGSPQ